MLATTDTRAAGELLQAFLDTDYAVSISGREYVISVGRRHDMLDKAIGGRAWAIVTAYNPAAIRLDDSANRRRHDALLEAVRTAGLDHFDACNRDPGGQWPEEPGLLIVEPEGQWLDALARKFGQAGIVTGRARERAVLCLYGPHWPESLPDCVTRAG